MWEGIEEYLDIEDDRAIEYGIFQLETKVGTPLWRRHHGSGVGRFSTVRNALFARQGARASCLGQAPYPKTRYSATGRLVVPFVATWLAGREIACLVRSAASDPEITFVHPNQLAGLAPTTAVELTQFLSELYSEGVANFGAGRLARHRIVVP